jgi:hypothetical protein
MHRGHDDDHRDGAGAAGRIADAGHNRPELRGRPLQWQTPHRSDGPPAEHDHGEPDLDLVEAAFVEGFGDAGDPTSFLRMAHVPFDAVSTDGARLSLLRVEVNAATDVGAITPHLGGTTFRYDPLPARMISRRKRLRFVYFDGQRLHSLDLAQVRALAVPVPGA